LAETAAAEISADGLTYLTVDRQIGISIAKLRRRMRTRVDMFSWVIAISVALYLIFQYRVYVAVFLSW